MKKKHVLTISLLVIIFIIGNIVYISKFRGLNILDRDSISIIKEIIKKMHMSLISYTYRIDQIL